MVDTSSHPSDEARDLLEKITQKSTSWFRFTEETEAKVAQSLRRMTVDEPFLSVGGLKGK